MKKIGPKYFSVLLEEGKEKQDKKYNGKRRSSSIRERKLFIIGSWDNVFELKNRYKGSRILDATEITKEEFYKYKTI